MDQERAIIGIDISNDPIGPLIYMYSPYEACVQLPRLKLTGWVKPHLMLFATANGVILILFLAGWSNAKTLACFMTTPWINLCNGVKLELSYCVPRFHR